MRLTEEHVIVKMRATNKEAVLRELSALAEQHAAELSQDRIFTALMAREAIASTAIGGGAAIPHAKVEGLQQSRLIVLGRSAKSLPFDMGRGHRAQCFALLLGRPGQNMEYLHALAILGRILRQHDALNLLLTAQNNKELATAFNRAWQMMTMHPIAWEEVDVIQA